ncbi:MAG: hypothetical protein OQK94_03695 [Gammaproteobacteria bacterium]|nr:hypothetical protein [Gammaproteobacteria bacterium]MCW8841423.1 hypothetical protein [Gammaproteobacteria bacterium]MCW8928385.1 hypothetical protein [Gammaproteobacteria bacterium]MCW8957962.1 hypothetical protein [Gammaproteobacteria bacterium]MCW8973960.1 hypothetical protein [Gammaproteobacteria bacterium]
MEPISYQYRFSFESGREEIFDIRLDAKNLDALDPLTEEPPEWTHLDKNKCSHCPLDSLKVRFCPLARRLVPLVQRMGDVTSIDNVDVTVKLDERTVTRTATAQRGLSSLMGIITATSGCPHTVFFKPMARFHLPFANTDETLYRAASMYMLGQYYRWQAGKSVDLELEGLLKFYSQVAGVNKGIANRLRAEQREDSTVNAIVLLDMFVKSMPVMISETLDELKPLFQPYIDAESIL